MKDINPLWAYTIIFLVSLFGAYITFGLLQSTGTIEDDNIKLGGSIAGFLFIFVVFARLYSSDLNKLRAIELKRKKLYNLQFKIKDESCDQIIMPPPRLVENQGYLTIRDINGKKRNNKPQKISLVESNAGWNFYFDKDVEETDGLYLDLVDKSGQKWVARFRAYQIQLDVYQN